MRTITKIFKKTEQKLFCHSEGCCPKNLVTTEPVILSTAKNLSSDPSRSLRTTSLSSRFIKASQTGSIMLEVVAVLALMGVMGSMLFRQIYQRNQELHNIQMASEIRTVKEAFSAYIQANRAALLSRCTTPTCDTNGCEVKQCNFDYDAVADYLPDGWFSNAEELQAAYHLTLWNYLQNDGTERRVIYGIVVPTAGTLPTTGWNFRRAARVALLVGADGGAYDSTITGEYISGSLGSWQIEKEGVIHDDNDCPADVEGCPTYVAMTGIDIFAPEYEAGEGEVNLPSTWSLALNNLHAYNYFSVGNSKRGSCYIIQHHGTREEGGKDTVRPDEITTGNDNNCAPLFWVGTESGGAAPNNGNVYVATDLNIGQIGSDNEHDSALKLTAEGVIKQKDGLTIDKDGRIISKETVSANIGELVSGEHFVVDPAYTSTMNDIRLASRGGVRLSDILPNYILKNQTNISCSISTSQSSCSANVPKPTDCPTGYKIGLVVIPTVFGKNSVAKTTTNTTGTIPEASGHSHTHNLSLNVNGTAIDGEIAESGAHTHTVSNGSLTTTLTQRQFQVRISTLGDIPVKGDQSNGNWSVFFGYDSNVDTNETVYAIAQTYCVWEPSLLTTEATCKAAGYTWDSTKPVGSRCQNTHLVDTTMNGSVKGAERSQDSCKKAGLTWDSNRCQATYADAATINSYSSYSIDEKKVACKLAGHTWDSTQNRCE